jgi:hypothetical protein
MEVLHQFLVEPFHSGNSICDGQLRHQPDLVDNRRWQVHASLRKVLAKISEASTNLSEFRLLGWSIVAASSILSFRIILYHLHLFISASGVLDLAISAWLNF